MGKNPLCQTLEIYDFSSLAGKKTDFDRNELWLQGMNIKANVPITLEFWFSGEII